MSAMRWEHCWNFCGSRRCREICGVTFQEFWNYAETAHFHIKELRATACCEERHSPFYQDRQKSDLFHFSLLLQDRSVTTERFLVVRVLFSMFIKSVSGTATHQSCIQFITESLGKNKYFTIKEDFFLSVVKENSNLVMSMVNLDELVSSQVAQVKNINFFKKWLSHPT